MSSSSSGKDQKKSKIIPKTEREIRLASYESLFNDLVSMGKSIEDALFIIEKLQREEESRNEAEENDKKKKKEAIKFRIQYPVKDILRINPKFDQLSSKEQNDYLWSIGFDTKKRSTYREHIQYMNADGKRDFGEVIYGSERLDKEWLNMRNPHTASKIASEDAQDYYRMNKTKINKGK